MKIASTWTVHENRKMLPRNNQAIKNEPMLFNCDVGGARHNGGTITKEFLAILPAGWHDAPLVIDSRVHMLMPGWFPCIPGYHHDDVPRTRQDGQPNYGPGQVRSEHIMALVGGDICPTEFAIGTAEFVEPAIGRTIYADWHSDVDMLCKNGVLEHHKAPSNMLIQFDDRTWHQGSAAVASGWRFFIRASRYFTSDGQPVERHGTRTNEVRKQVQVYMGSPFDGW